MTTQPIFLLLLSLEPPPSQPLSKVKGILLPVANPTIDHSLLHLRDSSNQPTPLFQLPSWLLFQEEKRSSNIERGPRLWLPTGIPGGQEQHQITHLEPIQCNLGPGLVIQLLSHGTVVVGLFLQLASEILQVLESLGHLLNVDYKQKI
jgi:hypothetical protein